ncbi:MAG: AlkZ family DNA glycosylase [Caldilineaceae bacterium]|nr:AlkZ family DNA glycosylase [Caldilineaceae bacterium]
MSTNRLTPEQVRWQRFQRAGLAKPFADAPTAASALIGVQAQILPAAGLALWNRTPAFNHTDFEAHIFNDRTLVKLWGQRGTLHLYASNDWPLLHAARTINRTWWERQAARDGENGEQALAEHRQLVEQVAELLRSQETLGRRELRASGLPLGDELLSPWGGIFADLVRMGYACHYGRSEGEGRFVARERWLPDLAWEPPDPITANVTVAARYFAAYGPSTLQDFAYWRGVATGQARGWLAQLMAEMVEVEIEGQSALLPSSAIDEAQQAPPPPEAWPVRMLYRFDPYLLAHRNKDWVVPPSHYKAVFRPAGHIEGIVVARGQAVATWRYDRKGGGLIIQVNPFKPLPKYVMKQVEKQANQVAAFFHLPLVDLVVNH